MLLNVSSTSELSIGDIVIIEGTGEKLENSDEPSLIVCSAENESRSEMLGVIPFSEKTPEGCATGVEFVKKYPEMKLKENKRKAKVVAIGESKHIFTNYSVEIIDKMSDKVKESIENMEKVGYKSIEYTVKGAILQHPARMDVVDDFNQGKKVIVHIQLNHSGEPTIVYPGHEEGHAGEFITAGEIIYQDGQLEELMKILKEKPHVEAVVFESANNAYKIKMALEEDEHESIVTGKKVESIDDLMNDIHKSVGTPLDTLEEIYIYLTSQDVPNSRIRALMKMIRPYDSSVVNYIPQKPLTPFHDKKGLLQRAIVYLLGRESVLMAGDAATGKNLLIETLCWVIQKPYRFYSINIQSDKYDLTGRTILQGHEEGGGTKVQDSFLISMMKHGGAILLDEINASNPAIMTVLHSITEKGHKMIDVESSDERVVAQEDFVLFAAMNPGYSGTNDLNEALHSRFTTLNFGQNDDILDLLKIHHESKDAPDSMLRQVNQLYKSLFNSVKEGTINAKVLSFRRYASAVRYAADGLIPLSESLIDNVANMVLDPFENDIIKDAIDTHIG